MWCSRGCLGPPASSDACLWHVSLAGVARRRGCAAAGVSVIFNGLLGRLLLRGALALGGRLRLRVYRERDAGDGQTTSDEELADRFDREVAAARAVPMPDAVVEAEDRAGEHARVCLRDRALLHAAGEEGGPGELEVAHLRACELTRLLFAGRRAMEAGERLLGDQDAIAQDVVVAQREGGIEHRLEPLGEVIVLGGRVVELRAVGRDGDRLDLVQAMQL